MKIPIDISGLADTAIQQIADELPGRALDASHEIRNAVMEVLSGPRSGKIYRKPTGGKYRASAPGEPPAWRLGNLGGKWRAVTYGEGNQNPAIETHIEYAWLDEGSPGGMIKPRPYVDKTIETAMPEVEKIYSEPFDFDL